MAEREAAPTAPLDGFVSDPALRRLFDYWRGKRRGRPMPAKDDIDPIEIPWSLTRIFLMDYDPATGFRYRLAGSEISDVFGRGNLKGLTFADILPPQGAEVVAERWRPMIEQPAAISMKGLVYLAADRTPVGERVLLPLADSADGPVTGVLGMTVCEWVAGLAPGEVKQSPLKILPVAEIP
ncbi:PAS domain-containing protein [Pelagibius sp. 7325]|uniref:PAS domain-containing protein n=1 Tax=Pelagibius sp. 7325 TaxID=3131994 RepID=UPI0030EC96B9